MDVLFKVIRYVRDMYEGLQQGIENFEGDVQLGSSSKREVEFEDFGDVLCNSYFVIFVLDKVLSLQYLLLKIFYYIDCFVSW